MRLIFDSAWECLLLTCVFFIAPHARADLQIELTDIKTYNLSAEMISGKIQRVSLSPDCQLAALELSESNHHHLCIFNLKTREKIFLDPRIELGGYDEWKTSLLSQLYPLQDFDAQWNPSIIKGERWIAFVSNAIENQNDIFLFNIDKRKYVRVTSSFNSEVYPRWSYDGSALAYIQRSDDKDEVFIMKDFISLRKKIEQKSIGYVSIPILSDYYEKEIFKDSRTSFETESNWSLTPPVWIRENQLIIARKNNPTSQKTSLLIHNNSENKTNEELLDLDSVQSIIPMRTKNGVLFYSLNTTAKRGKSLLSYYELASRTNTQDFQIIFSEENSSIKNIYPLNDQNCFLVINKTDAEDMLNLCSIKHNKIIESKLRLPSSLKLYGESFASVSAQINSGNARTLTLLLAFNNEGTEYLSTARAVIPLLYEDEVLKQKILFDVGVAGAFVRYTGDAATGDFWPTGNMWFMIEPFPTSDYHFEFGLNGGYAPLTGSSSSSGSFSKYLWYGEGCIKGAYRVSPEIRPFVTASIGKGILNEKLSNGGLRKPILYGIGAGTDFYLSELYDLHFEIIYRKLSVDIDHFRSTNIKKDSFINIGFGISYKFSFSY